MFKTRQCFTKTHRVNHKCTKKWSRRQPSDPNKTKLSLEFTALLSSSHGTVTKALARLITALFR